ncbi:GIY-YIG nuclease family protein [Inquilinus sp. NPDC058860]|uniref:GIY-YIG nuclease family protein n=1 Tax=Inquilinus sp. NPDC058860 TaxID=3346652 RepID=UPI003680A517
MKSEDRKAAIAACKEQRVSAGIYAVRCVASGGTWVGRSPNLATARNRAWFMLRFGSHTHPGLQQAWRAHGEAAFTFEMVEILSEEDTTHFRDKRLKQRLEHWQAALKAGVI